MALSLNLTLLVQMVHFIGAYLFITRYLLKPGYEAVKEDDERAHQIRTAIIQQQQHIAQRVLRKHEQWLLCQEQFMLNKPALENNLILELPSGENEHLAMPSEGEIKKIVQDMSAVLKERVLHG